MSHGGADYTDYSSDSVCQNVTYSHRVQNYDAYNWCLVPDGGADAILFAGIAITAACVMSPKWSALLLLLAGSGYMCLVYYVNLKEASNAVVLWLGMRPADIFIFIFLPPLLLDSAVRIDFFSLRKVFIHVMFMAVILVGLLTFVMIPILLYAPGLNLSQQSWSSNEAALFGTMIGSTDAASVVLILKSAGAPEILSVILEGEALFNDASALTMFEIFKHLVQNKQSEALGSEIGEIVKEVLKAFGIGVLVGVAFGILVCILLRWIQYWNMPAAAEVAVSVAMGYMSYYITQTFCEASGVIAVVTLGLFGSATLLWGMSNKAMQDNLFFQFWDVFILLVNGIIFFYVGSSATNFIIRSTDPAGQHLSEGTCPWNSIGQLFRIMFAKLPLIYLITFTLRGLLSYITFNLFGLLKLGQNLGWRETSFISVAGLRGALSLILVSTVVTTELHGASTQDQLQWKCVQTEIALWVTFYVIFTLIINAPLLGPLLMLLGLTNVSPEQMHVRKQVKRTFVRFTTAAIQDMQQDEDEMHQGVDWEAVSSTADHAKALNKMFPDTPRNFSLSQFMMLLFSLPSDPNELQTADKQAAYSQGRLPTTEERDEDGASGGEDDRSSRTTTFFGRVRRATAAALHNTRHVLGLSRTTLQQSSSVGGGGDDGLSLGKASKVVGAESVSVVVDGHATSLSWQTDEQPDGSGGHGAHQLPAGDLEAPPLPPAVAGAATAGGGSRLPPGPVAEGTVHNPPDPPRTAASSGEARHAGGGSNANVRSAIGMNLVDAQALSDAMAAAAAATGMAEEDFSVHGGSHGRDASVRPLSHGSGGGGGSGGGPSSGQRGGSGNHGGGSVRGGSAASRPPPSSAVTPEMLRSMLVLAQQQDRALEKYLTSDGFGEDEQFTLGHRPLSNLPESPRASPNHSSSASSHRSSLSRTSAQQQQAVVGNVIVVRPETIVETKERLLSTELSTEDSSDLAAAAPTEAAPEFIELVTEGSGTAGAEDSGTGGAAAAAPSRPTSVPKTSSMGPGTSRFANAAQIPLDASKAGPPPQAPSAFEVASLQPSVGASPLLSTVKSGEVATAHLHHERTAPLRSYSSKCVTPLAYRSEGMICISLHLAEEPDEELAAQQPQPQQRPDSPQAAAAAALAAASAQPPLAPRFSGGGGGGSGRGMDASHHSSSLGRLSSKAAAMTTQASGNVAAAFEFWDPTTGPLSPPGRGAPSGDSDAFGGSRGVGPHLFRAGRTASTMPPPPSRHGDGLEASLTSPPSPAADNSYHQYSDNGGDDSHHRNMLVVGPGSKGAHEMHMTSAQCPAGGVRHFKKVLRATEQGNPKLHSISTTSMPSLARRTRGQQRDLGTTSVHQAFRESQFEEEEKNSDDDRSLGATSVPFKKQISNNKEAGGNLMTTSMSVFASRVKDSLMRASQPRAISHMNQVLPEYRLRLQAGLKQVFRGKYAGGMVSGGSYRILDFVCSKGLHDPEKQLALWSDAHGEISGRVLVFVARAVHYLRVTINKLRLSRWFFNRWWAKVLDLPSWALSTYLTRSVTVGLEVALEMWMVLAHSPQVQWLEFGGPAGSQLLEEVKQEAEAAWAFIVDRRIEAPERFQAIQTYRASVSVLSQQQSFVNEMGEGGMIDDSEADRLHEAIHKRLQYVERCGPVWHQPSLSQILRSTVFLRGQGPEIETWLRANATFKMHKKGEVVWQRESGDDQPPGIFIVIAGLVRCEVSLGGDDSPGGGEDAADGDPKTGWCFYIGSGGVGGLLAAYVQHDLRGVGMRRVIAEGNALGKGPVVMHVSRDAIASVRYLAQERGVPAFQAFHLAIARSVGSYVLDLMKHAVEIQLVQHVATLMEHAMTPPDGTYLEPSRRLMAAKALLQIDDASTMECLHELLELPPRSLALLLAGLGTEHLSLQEMTLKALTARANSVLELMRLAMPSSKLVVLQPGQLFSQSTTVVLIQGQLRPVVTLSREARPITVAATAATGAATATTATISGHRAHPRTMVHSSVKHRAPSLLLWTSEYFEVSTPPPQPAVLMAGVNGASLLVLGLGGGEASPEDDSSNNPSGHMSDNAAAAAAAAAADPPPLPGAIAFGGSGGRRAANKSSAELGRSSIDGKFKSLKTLGRNSLGRAVMGLPFLGRRSMGNATSPNTDSAE